MFIDKNGNYVISDDEVEEAYFVYKPYSKEMIPGIYSEPFVRYRNFSPKFSFEKSSLKKIMERRVRQDENLESEVLQDKGVQSEQQAINQIEEEKPKRKIKSLFSRRKSL